MQTPRWQADRRRAIDTLAAAHADVGEVEGPGRPLEIGRPLAHAYIIRIVAEFQGFARDLHDLTALELIIRSGAPTSAVAILHEAATAGRAIDQGNADLRSLKRDFGRLGVRNLFERISLRNGYWSGRGDRRATGRTSRS